MATKNTEERQARKAALAAAKARLEKRKKQRDYLEQLRVQKLQGIPSQRNDYGQHLVEATKQFVNELQKKPEEVPTSAKGEIVPGPISDLAVVHQVNAINMAQREKVQYVKEIQTDSLEIAQFAGLIMDNEAINTNQDNDAKKTKTNESILKSFMKSSVIAWSQNDEDLESNNDDEKSKDDENLNIINGLGLNEDDDKKEEVFIMDERESDELMNDYKFQHSFGLASKIMDLELGINEEHSIFYEIDIDTTNDNDDNGDQSERITLKKKITENSGRSITSINFSKFDPDIFLVSYASNVNSTLYTDIPDGTINIFNFSDNEPIHILECQSMITNAHFHPTKKNLILGSSSSGQILKWNLKQKQLKKTPESRSMISPPDNKKKDDKEPNTGHSAPIFWMSFLPSTKSKMQHILTLSNEPKLCLWRDVELYEPFTEFNIKLSKSGDVSSSTRQEISPPDSKQFGSSTREEISTTCFGYPDTYSHTNNSDLQNDSSSKNENYDSKIDINQNELNVVDDSHNDYLSNNNNQIWFGSDEGALYKTQINYRSDDRELIIKTKIEKSHHGPITSLKFHPQPSSLKKMMVANNLFLSSSFDWTVKLWHTQSNSPIASFTQMQDYVYDASWSPVKPGVFACGDGTGHLTIYNLSFSFESPINEPTLVSATAALTKVEWTLSGKNIIVGDSDGNIYIYDVAPSLYESSDSDIDKLESRIHRLLISNYN